MSRGCFCARLCISCVAVCIRFVFAGACLPCLFLFPYYTSSLRPPNPPDTHAHPRSSPFYSAQIPSVPRSTFPASPEAVVFALSSLYKTYRAFFFVRLRFRSVSPAQLNFSSSSSSLALSLALSVGYVHKYVGLFCCCSLASVSPCVRWRAIRRHGRKRRCVCEVVMLPMTRMRSERARQFKKTRSAIMGKREEGEGVGRTAEKSQPLCTPRTPLHGLLRFLSDYPLPHWPTFCARTLAFTHSWPP